MALPDTRERALPTGPAHEFSDAEIGALAHLYRGEVYRSTVWRTRLDTTTNWAVVTTGIALSVTYSSAEASPLPMVLVGLIVSVFLLFEARRYRYFNVWRARARLLETDFYAPMIRGEGVRLDSGWTELLAKDYREPRYHIGFTRAIGRRLRRIRLDLRYPSHRVLRQACHPPGAAGHPRRPLGTCRHWSDPGWLGRYRRGAVPRRLGGARACHTSHRDCRAAPAAERDCDGITPHPLGGTRPQLIEQRIRLGAGSRRMSDAHDSLAVWYPSANIIL